MKKTIIPKRLPKPTPIDSAAREYERNINRYVKAYIQLMQRGLKGLVPDLKEEAGNELPRADSYYNTSIKIRLDANAEKVIRALFASVQDQLQSLFPDSLLRKWAQSMVGHVNKKAKTNTKKYAKAIDVEIEPLLKDGKLNPFFENVIDENVGLIRSIPQEKAVTFKNTLISLINADAPQSLIAEKIQANFNLSKSKAKLIARDQTGKLNGKLNKYRQEQIGGKRYVWRGAMDHRERKDHKRLEGKTFDWSKPPVVDRATGRRGHPGEDYQCRCYAEMVLEDIVD